ncbi:hypothetical protein BaRGS_00002984 [Batillaria attramentaria]|uniref:XK-related protein n=1 Tax=Batillaria attramentaria TaxID=370345 RepID=A0ABD0M392_9CAEN
MFRKHDTGRYNNKSTIPCHIIYFLWRVCETGGRVLCIALFASTFEFWVFAVLGPHFLIMFSWTVWTTGNKSADKIFLRSCYGYVMLFYMPFHSAPSRYLYIVYYVIFYTENFLLLGLWAGMTSDRDAWFYMPGIVTVIVFFILHIVMLFLYYKVAHPKAKTITYCEKWDWKRVLTPSHPSNFEGRMEAVVRLVVYLPMANNSLDKKTRKSSVRLCEDQDDGRSSTDLNTETVCKVVRYLDKTRRDCDSTFQPPQCLTSDRQQPSG